MTRHLSIPAMLVVISLCISSCSGGKTKKNAQPPEQAPAPTEQAPDGKATAVPGTPGARPGAATPIPVKKRTPAELIAALPCKLEGKSGVFAVFPDNPISGQVCFGVYPLRGNEREIPIFDIQGGGIHFILHYSEGQTPAGGKIVRWEARNGKPCTDAACASKITFKRDTYSPPSEPGWTYTIFTPDKSVDMASTGGFIGLVIGDTKQIPLFK